MSYFFPLYSHSAAQQNYQFMQSSVLLDTVVVVALSALSIFSAKIMENISSDLANLLRFMPVALSLIWLLKRCLPASSSGEGGHERVRMNTQRERRQTRTNYTNSHERDIYRQFTQMPGPTLNPAPTHRESYASDRRDVPQARSTAHTQAHTSYPHGSNLRPAPTQPPGPTLNPAPAHRESYASDRRDVPQARSTTHTQAHTSYSGGSDVRSAAPTQVPGPTLNAAPKNRDGGRSLFRSELATEAENQSANQRSSTSVFFDFKKGNEGQASKPMFKAPDQR